MSISAEAEQTHSHDSAALRQDMEQLKKDFSALREDLRQGSSEQLHAGAQKAREQLQAGSQQARRQFGVVTDEIEARPFISIAAAFGIGLILGKTLSH